MKMSSTNQNDNNTVSSVIFLLLSYSVIHTDEYCTNETWPDFEFRQNIRK